VDDGLTRRTSGRMGIAGVPGEIKVRWHRALPNKPTSAILTRQNAKWYAVFYVELEATQTANPQTVGIEFGLTSLIALPIGETEPRPTFSKRAAKGLRKPQRALARCKRGSKQRAKRKAALAKYQKHVANTRGDHPHTLS
jgi:putative transposase